MNVDTQARGVIQGISPTRIFSRPCSSLDSELLANLKYGWGSLHKHVPTLQAPILRC